MEAQNAQHAVEHIKAGGRAFIPSYERCIVIDAKGLARWEKVGLELLRDDKDGRGIRMRQGKGSVYLYKGLLKLID